jgi:hypothetical protein
MIISIPGGVSQLPCSGVDHAHSDEASAPLAANASADASAAAASAAPASPSATLSANAAEAAAVPRIALHLLGTDGTVASATPRAETPSFVGPFFEEPPFGATPADDELDIIAGYLCQDDHFIMREIDASVRAVVDPTTHILKLSGREVCAALRQPHALHNLGVLHLMDCKDDDLIDLAAMLSKMPETDFELILEAGLFGRHRVSVVGIAPLAALRLAGLTLKGIPVPEAMSRALALSVSPLSITPPYLDDYESNIYEISQIPTLHSLTVGVSTMLTPETIDALRSHPALETLHVNALSGNAISLLATSERLRSLTVANIVNGEVRALSALADNPVLTSLSVGVNHANALAVLSRNVALQKLSISVSEIPPSLLSAFASMPTLEEFHLSRRGRGIMSMSVYDIAGLCAKPLKSLSFYDVHMDSGTRLFLATAQTANLRLQFCTPFETNDFAALGQNRSITSLVMNTHDIAENDDAILSMVKSGLPQLESLSVKVGSGTPNIAKDVIRAAWTASGRHLANLDMEVRFVSADLKGGYESDYY